MRRAGLTRSAPRTSNPDPEGLAPLSASAPRPKAGGLGAIASHVKKTFDAARKADRFEPPRPTKTQGLL